MTKHNLGTETENQISKLLKISTVFAVVPTQAGNLRSVESISTVSPHTAVQLPPTVCKHHAGWMFQPENDHRMGWRNYIKWIKEWTSYALKKDLSFMHQSFMQRNHSGSLAPTDWFTQNIKKTTTERKNNDRLQKSRWCVRRWDRCSPRCNIQFSMVTFNKKVRKMAVPWETSRRWLQKQVTLVSQCKHIHRTAWLQKKEKKKKVLFVWLLSCE